MSWEKSIELHKQNQLLYAFSENEVFSGLKSALTNTEFLGSDRIHFFTNKYLPISPEMKEKILSDSTEIRKITCKTELCNYLKLVLNVPYLGVFIGGFFPFVKDSVPRIGLIVDQLFKNDAQIPGSDLNFDVFFGDYPKTLHGIHRDGSNISFIYSNKQYAFWKYNELKNEADAHSIKSNTRAAFSSGAFFFPKEMQQKLHERFDEKSETFNLQSGDVIYWPTELWHISENKDKSVALTLNITFYKSDYLAIKESLNKTIIKQEMESFTLIGNSFYQQELIPNQQKRSELIENEYETLLMCISSMKAKYINHRENILEQHLSSFGIKHSFLKTLPVNTCPDVKETRIKKPYIYKLLYKIENQSFVSIHFFSYATKLPYTDEVISILNRINNSTNISYLELAEAHNHNETTNRMILRILNFLISTPGVLLEQSPELG